MLMARGELSFRIPPVSEAWAASKTIRLRWADGRLGVGDVVYLTSWSRRV